jgi:uncharacterized lipoprotein YajG
MDQNTKDILAAVNFIEDKVEQLPTKDDVRATVEEVVDERLSTDSCKFGRDQSPARCT